MAEKTKIKKTNKKGSYDNKIIKIIVASLAVFVAVVIGIAVMITLTTGYVAKVDGMKIYDYEYDYFLQVAQYEIYDEKFEEPEGFDDMTSEEQNKVVEAFWTEDIKNQIAERAMENARQFKAQYQLAKEAGFELSSEEEKNLKINIENYYNQYLSYGYYTEEQLQDYFFNGMKLDDYKEFAIVQTTIENYKTELKKDINPSNDEIKAIYDEEPDDYRIINIRQFQINIDAEKPTDEKADGYQTELDKYNKAKEEALKEAKEIIDTYSAGKNMFIPKVDKDGNPVKEEESGEIIYDNEKGYTFEEYVRLKSDDNYSSNNAGLYEINNNNSGSFKEVTEYALSMKWNKDKTQILKVEEKDGKETEVAVTDLKVEEGKKMTDDKYTYEIIETDTAILIVRVEDIVDFETSKESSEGAKDSIKDNIEAQLVEDKAVEMLESKVNAKGDTFKVEGKKEDEIKEINKSFFDLM